MSSSYIYVQRRTRRRLHLIAGASSAIKGNGVTADEVADMLLNEAIEAKYPAVLKAEKDIAAREEALAKELKQ